MKTRIHIPILSFTILWLFAMSGVVVGLAKGYNTTDSELKLGMTVSLVQNDGQAEAFVERASKETQANIIGIATSYMTNLTTVATKDQNVFVQTNGSVEAYVSDFGGKIEKGDRLVISPIRGVLTSLGTESESIVAVAEEPFSEARDREVKSIETSGGNRDVTVGKIMVNLDHKTSTSDQQDANSSLRRLGRSITGKEVSAARVAMAIVIFLVVLVVEGSIIYGAVSSAITAVGRNPLARRIIHQETFRAVLVALSVLMLGICSVYLILWL